MDIHAAQSHKGIIANGDVVARFFASTHNQGILTVRNRHCTTVDVGKYQTVQRKEFFTVVHIIVAVPIYGTSYGYSIRIPVIYAAPSDTVFSTSTLNGSQSLHVCRYSDVTASFVTITSTDTGSSHTTYGSDGTTLYLNTAAVVHNIVDTTANTGTTGAALRNQYASAKCFSFDDEVAVSPGTYPKRGVCILFRCTRAGNGVRRAVLQDNGGIVIAIYRTSCCADIHVIKGRLGCTTEGYPVRCRFTRTLDQSPGINDRHITFVDIAEYKLILIEISLTVILIVLSVKINHLINSHLFTSTIPQIAATDALVSVKPPECRQLGHIASNLDAFAIAVFVSTDTCRTLATRGCDDATTDVNAATGVVAIVKTAANSRRVGSALCNQRSVAHRLAQNSQVTVIILVSDPDSRVCNLVRCACTGDGIRRTVLQDDSTVAIAMNAPSIITDLYVVKCHS